MLVEDWPFHEFLYLVYSEKDREMEILCSQKNGRVDERSIGDSKNSRHVRADLDNPLLKRSKGEN